ncbi:MAG TPA: biopolymer transporter ExbD [Tepidisphaeraceae bacterium]|jgi:biopolymer transport protein TolR|nr:biopolymer transporter ExbD [Tepidisphaeraceae bacterium]
MGMTTPAGSGRKKKRLMADINVTPMVDVMLVLLVIFMITAPIIKQIDALQVTLPQVEGQPAQTILTEDARTLVISPEGEVSRSDAKSFEDHFASNAALIDDLKGYRQECEKEKKSPVVVIAGDRVAKWERVMQVWNCVKSAGITQISFQVDERKPGAESGIAR